MTPLSLNFLTRQERQETTVYYVQHLPCLSDKRTRISRAYSYSPCLHQTQTLPDLPLVLSSFHNEHHFSWREKPPAGARYLRHNYGESVSFTEKMRKNFLQVFFSYSTTSRGSSGDQNFTDKVEKIFSPFLRPPLHQKRPQSSIFLFKTSLQDPFYMMHNPTHKLTAIFSWQKKSFFWQGPSKTFCISNGQSIISMDAMTLSS